MQKNKITLKMSRSKDATKHIKLEMYRKIVIQSSRGGWVVEDTGANSSSNQSYKDPGSIPALVLVFKWRHLSLNRKKGHLLRAWK